MPSQTTSGAISRCLSSSTIAILLSETSLLPLRVTLAHFALSSYERALCLQTCFSILGLARFGVKPRLCRSFWRAFASIHRLILFPAFPREVSFACPPTPSWNRPSFAVKPTLSSPCSRSNPPLPRQGCGSRSP